MLPHSDETRTKIVCTLGPVTQDSAAIRALIREGMDVARINYSHGTHDEHRETFQRVRKEAAGAKAILAILADLQGPKLRIGELAKPLTLRAGDRIRLTEDLAADGTENVIPLPHPELIHSARSGGRLLFDDGALEAVVREVLPDSIVAEMTLGGTLSSHKGIAAPGGSQSLDALTEKDREDAAHAVACGADYIALSFVRSRQDIEGLRGVLDGLPNGGAVRIVAKIEKQEAIDHLDEILRVADAIMVARGDLGVEISPQRVPMYQKEIIRRCNRIGTPVITATQMLQSMTESPRPTRAEASDVANAILDGTDAVMLSNETAVGAYPVESVAMMREIAAIAEGSMPKRRDGDFEAVSHVHPVTDAISDATVRIADEVDAKMIVTSTWSGYTARQIARERPALSIVALTPDARVLRQLALVWGVSPLLVPQYEGTDAMLDVVSHALLEAGFAEPGDRVVISAGIPFGGGGKTNFVKVHRL
jgi:pyruvate kinase